MLVVGDALLRGIEAPICGPENRIFFDDSGLFEKDGIHLSGSGRVIFSSRLDNLVSLALNRRTLGVGSKVVILTPLQLTVE